MTDPWKLPDEELVTLIRNSDQNLYAIIVKRYQERLTRYAKYLIRDQEKAADAVQESFIKAFMNLQGFNTNKKFSSWIYRIVHNEAINIAKKYHREISLEQNSWTHKTLESEENVQLTADRKEVAASLRKSLSDLPIKYREPLALFYLEDQSYEEISDVLRIPTGTVGTRINRGKKLLRSLIKNYGQSK